MTHTAATNRARAHRIAKDAEREAMMVQDAQIARVRDLLARRPMPTIPQVAPPVDVTDEAQFPEIAAAIRHAASLRERRA